MKRFEMGNTRDGFHSPSLIRGITHPPLLMGGIIHSPLLMGGITH